MSSRSRFPKLLPVLVLVLGASAAWFWNRGGSAGPRALDRLPRDPIAAGMFVVEDPEGSLEYWLDLLGEFSGEGRTEIDAKLAELDEQLGFSLREDVLAEIGPEFAFSFDLTSIDEIAGAAVGGGGDGMSQILEQSLWLMEIRDRDKIDRAVRTFARLGGGEVSDVEDSTTITFSRGDRTVVELFYRVDEELLVVSFSPETLREAVGGGGRDSRLVDGADFARVFSHLDESPESLTYLNLPRLRSLIDESVLVKGWTAAQPARRRILEVFLRDEWTGVGMGATSVETDGGLQTTRFGPTLLLRFELYRALSLWMAGPSMLSASGILDRLVDDLATTPNATDPAPATPPHPITHPDPG